MTSLAQTNTEYLVWMDDFRFYVLYNSISVISGQWVGDNGRLCAMEPYLRLKRSLPQAGLKPRAARSVCQHLIYRARPALNILSYRGSSKYLVNLAM